MSLLAKIFGVNKAEEEAVTNGYVATEIRDEPIQVFTWHNSEPCTIGQAVRDARLKAGLTQRELAKKVYCSDQSMSMLERDKQYPSCHLLKKIATALNTPITFTITPE